MTEKFKIDIEQLQAAQISVLKTIYREGEKHLKYYEKTMSVFKYPEKRLKAYDTSYYEEVLPIIISILRNREEKGLL